MYKLSEDLLFPAIIIVWIRKQSQFGKRVKNLRHTADSIFFLRGWLDVSWRILKNSESLFVTLWLQCNDTSEAQTGDFDQPPDDICYLIYQNSHVSSFFPLFFFHFLSSLTGRFNICMVPALRPLGVTFMSCGEAHSAVLTKVQTSPVLSAWLSAECVGLRSTESDKVVLWFLGWPGFHFWRGMPRSARSRLLCWWTDTQTGRRCGRTRLTDRLRQVKTWRVFMWTVLIFGDTIITSGLQYPTLDV